MEESVEERIARQLDLLDDPDLTDADIERIEKKIELLKTLK